MGELSRIQFDILVALEETKARISQRKFATMLNKSIGTINKAMLSLTECGYINDGEYARLNTHRGI